MIDLKLNFDTKPDEETISPDKNCSICYGKGTMLVSVGWRTEFYSITSVTNDKNYDEKECSCITRQRVHEAREKHFAIYRAA